MAKVAQQFGGRGLTIFGFLAAAAALSVVIATAISGERIEPWILAAGVIAGGGAMRRVRRGAGSDQLAFVGDPVRLTVIARLIEDVAQIWNLVGIAVEARAIRDVTSVGNTVAVAVRFAFVGYAIPVAVLAGPEGDVTSVGNTVPVAVHPPVYDAGRMSNTPTTWSGAGANNPALAPPFSPLPS